VILIGTILSWAATQSDWRELAYWVMTQACSLAALKTDGPITGNITGSCHIRE